MKKTIDGRHYDTARSEKLHTYKNGTQDFDFEPEAYRETMYKTKRGLRFLHCEGGSMSIYSKSRVDGTRTAWGDGACILPMGEDEATLWLEARRAGVEGDAWEDYIDPDVLYNVATSTKIDFYEYGCRRSDSDWYKETLYKTPEGRHFLYGEGGMMSPYSESVPDDFGAVMGGCGKIPMTEEEAEEWIKKINS